MAREKRIQVKVTEEEYEVLKQESTRRGISMAEILREVIKKLMDKRKIEE